MILASSAALAAGLLSLGGAFAAQTAPAPATAHTQFDFKRACPVATRPGRMACMVLIRTNVPHIAPGVLAPNAAPVGDGYGPPSLDSAYKLPTSTNGAGETVAVVDAFNDPSAAADLATYRSAWGCLPVAPDASAW